MRLYNLLLFWQLLVLKTYIFWLRTANALSPFRDKSQRLVSFVTSMNKVKYNRVAMENWCTGCLLSPVLVFILWAELLRIYWCSLCICVRATAECASPLSGPQSRPMHRHGCMSHRAARNTHTQQRKPTKCTLCERKRCFSTAAIRISVKSDALCPAAMLDRGHARWGFPLIFEIRIVISTFRIQTVFFFLISV